MQSNCPFNQPIHLQSINQSTPLFNRPILLQSINQSIELSVEKVKPSKLHKFKWTALHKNTKIARQIWNLLGQVMQQESKPGVGNRFQQIIHLLLLISLQRETAETFTAIFAPHLTQSVWRVPEKHRKNLKYSFGRSKCKIKPDPLTKCIRGFVSKQPPRLSPHTAISRECGPRFEIESSDSCFLLCTTKNSTQMAITSRKWKTWKQRIFPFEKRGFSYRKFNAKFQYNEVELMLM